MSKNKKNSQTAYQLSGLLGYGSDFNGEILFEGMFRVDGNLSGKIICDKSTPSTVIVSKNSVIEADIVADNVIIAGRVLGKVLAMNKIEVFSEGRLEGLIFTDELVMNKGALFHGQCIMLKNLDMKKKEQLKQDFIENKTPEILSHNQIENYTQYSNDSLNQHFILT